MKEPVCCPAVEQTYPHVDDEPHLFTGVLNGEIPWAIKDIKCTKLSLSTE